MFYSIIDSDISRESRPFKINSHMSEKANQAGARSGKAKSVVLTICIYVMRKCAYSNCTNVRNTDRVIAIL